MVKRLQQRRSRTKDKELRAHLRVEMRELEAKIKRLKGELGKKMRRENRELLDVLRKQDPWNFFRLLKGQVQQPEIPVPFQDQVAYVERVASATYVTRAPVDSTIVEPPQRRATKVGPEELLLPFSTKSVQMTLMRKLANGKAADLEGNVPEQIKYAPDGLIEVLTWIMNKALAGDPLPGWGTVLLALLPKKPPRTVIENYRGVSIERVIEKGFSTL